MNKEDLTIGILIPVYNVADYVEECIESILTQIDTRASILIMNDASTDNSTAIIKRFENHPQVQIFDAPYNRGLSATRNTLFDMAQTEYIWFIDSDDVMYENAYSSVMSQIEKLKSDVLCADYVSLRGKKEVKKKAFLGKANKNYINNNNNFLDNIIQNKSNHIWNKVFRRQLIQDVRFKEGVNFEDIYYITDVSNNHFKFSYLKMPIIKYRERQGSIVQNLNEKYVDNYLSAFQYRIEKYKVVDDNELGFIYLKYKVYKHYTGLITKLDKNKQAQLLSYVDIHYSDYFSKLYSATYNRLSFFQKKIIRLKKSKVDMLFKKKGHKS
ncbi:glycosyltransferase family 2 protein [Psychrobacter immobilis]|uniref:glycosyltransferase family 2 protein n=1 Tax=Psychrobacter immobilis TaxID=498 RepID=UPI0019187E8F|nr:glycosyltransferase [Psychrobacter immobilis]